ncbi:MAG: hypothetical protein JWM19_4933 [Actinomycetia bacterium]|nr:hypothetical protein [Actinomycetes bacterium]
MVGVTAGVPSYGQQAPQGGLSLVRKDCVAAAVVIAGSLRGGAPDAVRPLHSPPHGSPATTRPAALPAQSANALGLAGDVA